MSHSLRPAFAKVISKSAAEAQEQFPERLRRLLVFAKHSSTPVFVSEEIAGHLAQSIDAVSTAIKRHTDDLHNLNAGGYISRFAAVAGKPVRLLVVDDQPKGVFTEKFTQEMRATYFLDHELGHYVVPRGAAGGHMGECAADAFAALRHIQRHGMDTDFFSYTQKASSIVLGSSPIHYTAAVFRRVREIAQERDITKLSLTETAGLADSIAGEAARTPDALDRLTQAFAPAVAAYRAAYGSKQAIGEKLYAQDAGAYALFARETLKVMKASADKDVQTVAQEFLDYPPMRKFIDQNPALLATHAPKPAPGITP